MITKHLLSFLIWLPIVSGSGILAIGNDRPKLAKNFTLISSILVFFLSILIYLGFDNSTANMQFTEYYSWIDSLNINYSLGIDGISMPLILLTTFLTVLVIISSWQAITNQISKYLAAFLIMEGMMIAVFASLDAILFYVFWEAMLIPMFLIIGIWGGPNRIYATIKFFLYTLIGSLLMLLAILYLHNLSQGSFNILDYYPLKIEMNAQVLIFFAFLAAFAIKVPMFPVHTWLPDAHVEAPTGGSIILAAIMLKMGTYGFMRFILPITPNASQELDWLMITLSLIAVVYIAFIALVQQDIKKLIAYSSISHMGLVTLGLFIFNAHGVEGAMIQMISHGVISGALFLCVGILYDRLHSRMISSYGGVARTMPVFASFAVFFGFSNSGLPGTSGFVGEVFVIFGSFQVNPWFAIIAALTLIFSAAYTLWMLKRVLYGKIFNNDVSLLKDIDSRETLMLAVLATTICFIGVWPNPIFDVMHVTIDNLLHHILISKLP